MTRKYARLEELLEQNIQEQKLRRKWLPEVWQTVTVFFASATITTLVNFRLAPGTFRWEHLGEIKVILLSTSLLAAAAGLLWLNALRMIKARSS